MAGVEAGRPIAFLFLGETLLIPHLYPVMASVARRAAGRSIEAWTATQTHEALLRRWISADALPNARLRRAPGWRSTTAPELGANPPLPAKIPLLARLAPHLMRAAAVVCAEQTSLWLPHVLGPVGLMPPFIKTSHGAGTMSARDDPRRRASALMLVPSEAERETYLARGVEPSRIVATGYVKSGFRHLSASSPAFAASRPVVLYNPHWQPSRSSWWAWGREVIERVLASGRYNLIFAPHQRLVEGVSELGEFCARLNARTDAVADIDSFAAVDGSYPATADIYVGDTSSQVLEFLQRPRPAIFLNPAGWDRKTDPSLSMWDAGKIVNTLAGLLPALDTAAIWGPPLEPSQARITGELLGVTDGSGPDRAADEIMRFLTRTGR